MDTEVDEALLTACVNMAGPIAEANAAMLEIMSDDSLDPQDAVDMWTALADAFGEIAESAMHPEFKAAATAAHEDIVAVRDAMQKVYVEEDMSAVGDFTAATSAWQESYSALLELCAG